MRAQLFPGLEPGYAGYVAWRALVDENVLPAELRRRLGNTYWFGLPPGEMIVAYPVPARDGAPGHRDWNIVWYRPDPRGRRRCATCAPTQEVGIMVPRFRRRS